VEWKKSGAETYAIKVPITSKMLGGTFLQMKINRFGVYSINITYERLNPFVRWDTKHDDGNSIEDPCTGEVIDAPHKHRYNTNEQGQCIVKIPESEITRFDVNQAFWDFLKELNIKLNPDKYVPLTPVIAPRLGKYIEAI
jgi:hypothetical protein